MFVEMPDHQQTCATSAALVLLQASEAFRRSSESMADDEIPVLVPDPSASLAHAVQPDDADPDEYDHDCPAQMQWPAHPTPGAGTRKAAKVSDAGGLRARAARGNQHAGAQSVMVHTLGTGTYVAGSGVGFRGSGRQARHGVHVQQASVTPSHEDVTGFDGVCH
jgi:hypothetical protein